MKTIPMTHYEVIKQNSDLYFGSTIEDIFESHGRNLDFMHLKKYVEEDKSINSIPFVDNEDANMAVRMIYHITRMNHFGEKIYHFTSEVCDIIHNTNPKIDAEFVEAPFEEMFISLDQSKIRMQDANDEQPMKGLYISLRVESDGIKKLRFLATSSAESMRENHDVNHFACFHIPEHGDLEEIIDNMRIAHEKGLQTGKIINKNSIYEIFKFAVGCLLYIGCKNANFTNVNPFTIEEAVKGKGPKKAKIISRRMSKVTQQPYIYVTHNHGYSSGKSSGTGKKLDHSVLVAGYWRGQWYGSEKIGDRRKEIIRVSSYTKGVGQMSNKKYLVK